MSSMHGVAYWCQYCNCYTNTQHNHLLPTTYAPTYTYSPLQICPVCGNIPTAHYRQDDDGNWKTDCPIVADLISSIKSLIQALNDK